MLIEKRKIRKSLPKREPFYEEMGKITDRFIATHIDSYVTAGQLRYKVSSMTYPEAQAVFDRLSERVKKSKLGQEVYQEIQKLKNEIPTAKRQYAQ